MLKDSVKTEPHLSCTSGRMTVFSCNMPNIGWAMLICIDGEHRFLWESNKSNHTILRKAGMYLSFCPHHSTNLQSVLGEWQPNLYYRHGLVGPYTLYYKNELGNLARVRVSKILDCIGHSPAFPLYNVIKEAVAIPNTSFTVPLRTARTQDDPWIC